MFSKPLVVRIQIWSALDEADYTGAVEFFLLGRYLSVKMHLTGEAMAAHVNPRVLVKRQWAALDDIKNTIASACRKQLALLTVSDEVSESFLVLPGDISPVEEIMFHQFVH